MTGVWRSPLWLLLAPIALCGAALMLRPETWAPSPHGRLSPNRVYAYRQWQSAGVDVEKGDVITLRATGEWQYSPFVGLHGPEGGGRPVTVPTYPMSGADGGVLLGRIGEGTPFYVGRGATMVVQEAGRLYFRINDDLLGDNKGQLTVTIEVRSPTTTSR
ncbi:MAG: hypothetical protein ACT4QE_22660 [Anaerolineales bacterium]